jgi:hypothetical protein
MWVGVYSRAMSNTTREEKHMTITETQKPVGKNAEGKVRVYEIDGPSLETVTSFWQWLKDQRTIEDYKISA